MCTNSSTERTVVNRSGKMETGLLGRERDEACRGGGRDNTSEGGLDWATKRLLISAHSPASITAVLMSICGSFFQALYTFYWRNLKRLHVLTSMDLSGQSPLCSPDKTANKVVPSFACWPTGSITAPFFYHAIAYLFTNTSACNTFGFLIKSKGTVRLSLKLLKNSQGLSNFHHLAQITHLKLTAGYDTSLNAVVDVCKFRETSS